MAVAAAVTTGVTAALATTLLPVLLPRLDGFLSAGRVRRPGDARTSWERWARHLMCHPWPYLGGAMAVLVLMAVPVVGLRLGVDLDRASLAHSEVGVGLAQMERDGLANVTLLALPHAAGQGPVDTTDLTEALAGDPRVVTPMALDNGRDLTVVAVVDRIPADRPAAGALLNDLRRRAGRTLPGGQEVLCAGQAADLADLQQAMRAALWQVAVLVLAGTFVLMLVVFRSLVLLVKAIAMNLLSTGAAFGLLSWFTGHTANVVVPLMAVTLVFGLSLDYEVFLVHRITEHYRAGTACREAVARGLSGTAQPITLAAATMSVVFAGLLATGRQELRQVGFLVAVAVLLDATVIRLVVVPALMQLLGHRNWWLPAPLARLLPPVPTPAPSSAPRVPRPSRTEKDPAPTVLSHREETRSVHEQHPVGIAHITDLDGQGRLPAHRGCPDRTGDRVRHAEHDHRHGEQLPPRPVLQGRDPHGPPDQLQPGAHPAAAPHPNHGDPPPDRMLRRQPAVAQRHFHDPGHRASRLQRRLRRPRLREHHLVRRQRAPDRNLHRAPHPTFRHRLQPRQRPA
ncbi:hypothetical protein ADK54_05355 [Streptomyces sp. WM6378]|nr:hypothetical protein ADK54_05355 [Streptomyces sp. WM6378]